jgi:hypothetical protein
LHHIETENILADEQFGFRISSTDKDSYKLFDEILKALNNLPTQLCEEPSAD